MSGMEVSRAGFEAPVWVGITDLLGDHSLQAA